MVFQWQESIWIKIATRFLIFCHVSLHDFHSWSKVTFRKEIRRVRKKVLSFNCNVKDINFDFLADVFPFREFFTHYETSLLSMRGCEFILVLVAHGNLNFRRNLISPIHLGYPLSSSTLSPVSRNQFWHSSDKKNG